MMSVITRRRRRRRRRSSRGLSAKTYPARVSLLYICKALLITNLIMPTANTRQFLCAYASQWQCGRLMEKRIIILFECNGKRRMEQNIMFIINVSIASKVQVPGEKKTYFESKEPAKRRYDISILCIYIIYTPI